jgi:hypothetical protein
MHQYAIVIMYNAGHCRSFHRRRLLKSELVGAGRIPGTRNCYRPSCVDESALSLMKVSIGGEADIRERHREFDAVGGPGASELISQLRATVEAAGRVLSHVDPATLVEPRRIQSYDLTVMRAIYTVVEHFSMHTGQIMLLAKMFKGDLGLYNLSGGEPRPTWKGGIDGH